MPARHAPHAELVRLSRTSIADEVREEWTRWMCVPLYILLPRFQGVAPALVVGGEDRGHWHATRGDSCEARQSLKRTHNCTRSPYAM